MKAVIQRVISSCVSVDGNIVGNIGNGLNVLLGVVDGDSANEASLLAKKISDLRIFSDENGKMNLSVLDINGEILVISQFTLCADCKKGNRPSFTSSAPPDTAESLYLYFADELKKSGVRKVERGIFAASMLVDIKNDGPVTIVFDTDLWNKNK